MQFTLNIFRPQKSDSRFCRRLSRPGSVGRGRPPGLVVLRRAEVEERLSLETRSLADRPKQSRK